MIITRQSRERMSKKTLTDLASEYATEFAHLLGYNGDVAIGETEVIFDRREAREVFLKKFQPKTYSKALKKMAKIRYQDLKTKINDGLAFVQDGVVYIPITDLTEEERGLVSYLRPDEATKFGFLERIFLNKNEPYCSLNGFGSEIAHLVGDKIYRGRVHNGLGECLDIASQLFELSRNVHFLTRTTAKTDESSPVLSRYIEDYVSKRRGEIELYESLLFGGEDATKQKAVEIGLCKHNNVDFAVALLKKQYAMSTHYDGTLLFVEIFDSVGGDLSRTYTRLGEILANPSVTNVETALKELGYSPDRLLRYKGIFGKDIIERAKRVVSAD